MSGPDVEIVRLADFLAGISHVVLEVDRFEQGEIARTIFRRNRWLIRLLPAIPCLSLRER